MSRTIRCRGQLAALALLLFILAQPALAQPRRGRPAQENRRADLAERYLLPIRREFTVDGQSRSALVFAPRTSRERPTPLVLMFHGSGGTSEKSARMVGLHREWPQAIVVYPQGRTRDQGPMSGKTGWRLREDGDLAFVDHLLTTLKAELNVDADRIHAAGHSNGGFFCYLLWQQRGDVFASYSPVACFSRQTREGFSPAPVFHVAGRKDPLVQLQEQMETVRWVQEVNRCSEGVRTRDPGCRLFRSEIQKPLLVMIHPGGHEFPESAVPVMVRFFRRQSRGPVDNSSTDAAVQ